MRVHYRAHRQNRSAYELLSGGRPRGWSARHLRSRMAGAIDKLAPSASRAGSAALSRDRARHARVWALVGIRSTWRLRAGADRARYARAAGFDRAQEGG